MITKDTFSTMRDNAEFNHAQEEIRAAKDIQRDHPEATWTECLVAAKQLCKETT
jgi:hypothetical protein